MITILQVNRCTTHRCYVTSRALLLGGLYTYTTGGRARGRMLLFTDWLTILREASFPLLSLGYKRNDSSSMILCRIVTSTYGCRRDAILQEMQLRPRNTGPVFQGGKEISPLFIERIGKPLLPYLHCHAEGKTLSHHHDTNHRVFFSAVPNSL